MVAFADEGVELRAAGITIPIGVMNPEPEAFDHMIEFNWNRRFILSNYWRLSTGPDQTWHRKISCTFEIEYRDESFRLGSGRSARFAEVFRNETESHNPFHVFTFGRE